MNNKPTNNTTVTIEKLKGIFQLSADAYESSRAEAELVERFYHNEYYTEAQLRQIAEIGQNPETFNLVFMFTRHLIGYYSKVLNTVKLNAVQEQDIPVVTLLQDVKDYIDAQNNWHTLSNRIKKDAFIHGIFATYLNVIKQENVDGTPKKDRWGRQLYEIKKEYINPSELLLDPHSREQNYSDARFIHRFKWLDTTEVKELFPNVDLDKLEINHNHTGLENQEIERYYNQVGYQEAMGYDDKYLIVHTVLKTAKGWRSVYWCNDEILSNESIKYAEVKNPYTITKLSDINKAQYYGVFHSVIESIKVVHQSLLQIQLNINSDKVFVEENAVDNIDHFTKAYKRIAGIIPVKYIAGIKVEKLSTETQEQFINMDKAFDRIKTILGISDAFLGMAFQYDSGRKVRLQQNATSVGLQYIDDTIGLFYKTDTEKIIKLVKQYYRANQVLNMVDEHTGSRWVEINKPIINPITQQPFFEQALDPNDGKPIYTPNGVPVVAPINHPQTDIEFAECDVQVTSLDYNDDEANQVMIETVINGNAGQMLMQINPSGYAEIVALSIAQTKTRNSRQVADIFKQTAQMLQPQPHLQEQLANQSGGGSGANGGQNTPRYTNSLVGENQ